MISESAAVVNVGGGELQITLFVHGEVLTTQQLVLGTMRLAQLFADGNLRSDNIKQQMKELIDKEMEVFKAQYYQNRTIKYLILTGDYSLDVMRRMDKNLDNTINHIYMHLRDQKNKLYQTAQYNLYDIFAEP